MGWIRNLNFRSGYPGGLYLDASFDAPRELHDWWAMNGMDRLAIFAGRRLAYEGYLIERERIYSAGADETLAAHLVGGFGAILMKERMAKAWQDIRIDDEFWREQKDITVYTGAEKATVDRNNRLRFTPKEVAWVSGEFGAVRYTMSIGETTKTVSYVCTVAPGGQSWEVAAYRSTNGTSWTLMNNANGDTFAFGLTTSVQTTGTQQVIITLGTPSRYVELRFYARANQTPATDGTIYGELTELTITSASGLAADTVAADIVAAYSDKLNADVEHIFPINLSLGPFVAEDDTLADILDEAIAKGDVNHNRLAFGLLASDRARTPDGKPVLFLETYPDPAAGYDLVISRQDQEDGIVGDVDVSKDWSRVANSIHLRFNDAQGYTVRLTPDDDATLKDQTSIDRWGRLPGLVSLGYSVQATALANAKRILKTYKDPLNVAQPISVTGAIRTASSGRIHAALCRAGLRLKLADVVDELTGAPATMVITGTSYDDESETAQLTFGQAQDPLLTILEAPLITEDEEEDGGSGGGGGKTGHTQIWKLLGMTREQYEAKGGKAWWATSEEKKAAIRRKKKTGRYKPQK
jgi:hypothetical protein